MIWVVCGAARGVGKSWVARGLIAALPRAVHVKHGHGDARSDLATRLVHDVAEVRALVAAPLAGDHLVVESNALALEGTGDVVIFVDGPATDPHRRPDAAALKAHAHLVVARDVPEASWEAPLAAFLPDPDQRRAIRALLAAQRTHLLASVLRSRTKVWLEVDGRHGLGEGLAALLPAVAETGTLSAGARATGMSYRHAWDLVRDGEATLGIALVATRAGGRSGGSTALTPDALRLVSVFRDLEAEVEAFALERLAARLGG